MESEASYAAITLKDLARNEKRELRFSGGHGLCAGCGIPVVVRTVLNAIEKPVVVVNATGCLEVATSRYPNTAWGVPWLHNAFENAAATMSGVETAHRILRKKGRVKDEDIAFIVFGGDGGTYDIGLQSLSGAMERGHKIVYICYDNEAYMNTGNQRSGATPVGADTTTNPVGEQSYGKARQRKDLTAILIAHNIPFVAQASISHWHDLARKVRKAVAHAPAFINVLSTCQRGWGYQLEDSISIARLGVETCYWPLYEVNDGEWTLNFLPKEKRGIEEWLRPQKRFAHLFLDKNQGVLSRIQEEVDREWRRLLERCEGRLTQMETYKIVQPRVS
jgi:pyruvate ferredoxin oxidoreductase beta subunit